MTCDKWKKFIQVNIYGQTLQGLHQQGIALETMLSDIGCSKVWIVEGKMYNDDSCHQTVNSSEVSILKAPALSTTIADVKCPRFSTPAVSQVDLQRKFTLNLPIKFSEINSSYDEDFETSHDSGEESKASDDADIEELVNDILQKVSESDKETPIEQTIFSSTITGMNVPRCSTPINQHVDLLQTFDLHIPETVSEIGSNGEDETISDELMEECASNCHSTSLEYDGNLKHVSLRPHIIRVHTRSMMAMPKSGTLIRKRKSAASKLASTSIISRKQRVVLKESTSTDRMKNILKTLKKETSVIPTVEKLVQSNQKDMPLINIKRELSNENTIHLEYTEYAGNMIPVKPDVPLSSNNVSLMIAVIKTNNALDSHRQMTYIDYNNGENGGEEETLIIEHHGEEDYEDHCIHDEEDENHEIMHTPPPPGLINTKSILKDNTKVDRGMKKTVSFKVPKNKRSKLDQMHQIKCHFQSCERVFVWKMRYGKQRLLDHAMTHLTEKCLGCRTCDEALSTSNQLRYHYKKFHPEIKCLNFNILEVFNLEREDVAIAEIFRQCYEPQLSIIGKIGKNRNMRREKEKREESQVAEQEEETNHDNDAPSSSTNLF
uniref:ZIM-3 n=2 Tax=Caenorhabditis remanei TaxID=31234 RepID=A1A691_CAERE|nr:TPA_inf: ZIM-3 [Caenorhabditis remanei]